MPAAKRFCLICVLVSPIHIHPASFSKEGLEFELLISFIFKSRVLTLKERKRLIIFSVYFCTEIYKRGCQSVNNRCLDFLIFKNWAGWLSHNRPPNSCLHTQSADVLKTQATFSLSNLQSS